MSRFAFSASAGLTGDAANMRGILLMVLSMAGFAIEDSFIKATAATLSTGQILVMVGLGGAAVFYAYARLTGQVLISSALFGRRVMLRNGGEILGTAGYVSAFTLGDLSTASAVLQATPLFVALGAAVVFRERVGWRRWVAIVVGLCGVLIILRPGMAGFQPAALLAVLAVIGLGARDLITRTMPGTVSTLQLSFSAFLMIVPLGLAMMLFQDNRVPGGREFALLGGAIGFGTLAYMGIVGAMRVGEVSLVTPFRYSRILFALLLAVIFFQERPDALTLIGAAVIIGSGLFTLWREARARRRDQTQGRKRK